PRRPLLPPPPPPPPQPYPRRFRDPSISTGRLRRDNIARSRVLIHACVALPYSPLLRIVAIDPLIPLIPSSRIRWTIALLLMSADWSDCPAHQPGGSRNRVRLCFCEAGIHPLAR